MTQLTFEKFTTLIPDMIRKGIDKEHYHFIYAKQVFDCIVSLTDACCEILVGIHAINIGFVVSMHQNADGLYVAELKEEDYLLLRRVLRLSPSRDKFTSIVLLRLLSRNAPDYSKGEKIDYKTMRLYKKCRSIDESDKDIFCGWLDHIKDGKKAQNFAKTEFYLGKAVADYCRANNISSKWTNDISEEATYRNPWD